MGKYVTVQRIVRNVLNQEGCHDAQSQSYEAILEFPAFVGGETDVLLANRTVQKLLRRLEFGSPVLPLQPRVRLAGDSPVITLRGYWFAKEDAEVLERINNYVSLLDKECESVLETLSLLQDIGLSPRKVKGLLECMKERLQKLEHDVTQLRDAQAKKGDPPSV